jgi:hypothetical protein
VRGVEARLHPDVGEGQTFLIQLPLEDRLIGTSDRAMTMDSTPQCPQVPLEGYPQ